jgi:hypothetical protein
MSARKNPLPDDPTQMVLAALNTFVKRHPRAFENRFPLFDFGTWLCRMYCPQRAEPINAERQLGLFRKGAR